MANPEIQSKWYVKKLRINSGGYTDTGYYFGTGLPVYECLNDYNYYHTFRAEDRNHAIEQLKDLYNNQNLSFYKGKKL